ncbi:MAG: type II secretion system F family protein [Lentisphaeria bacterium]
MALKFTYTAMDGQGKEQRGKIDADNAQDAASKLKQQGLFPTGISEVKSSTPGGKAGGAPGAGGAAKKAGGFNMSMSFGGGGTPVIKRKQLTTVTRQLATLLDAGLPLVRALRTLERQARKDPNLRRAVGDLANSVEGGSTFSEALAGNPKSFNKLYINMVRAGEASGALETVLNRLAEFMEKAQRIAGKVKSAMVYPVIVLVIALTITAGLMVFIVPKFAKIFDEMLPGEPLPALTQLIISISVFMQQQILIMLGIIAAIVIGFKVFKNTKGGSYMIDLMMIKMPPFNQLAIRSSVARFCRTLGTLMQSGVAVLQALQIVKDTAGNEVVARAVQVVHDSVKEGEGMSKPMESTTIFPGMVVSMVEVGEETGALPEMLNRIADIYEEEVDRAVEGLTSMIEPIMIIFLAVIVGGIVLALFMPLIKLIDKMGGS